MMESDGDIGGRQGQECRQPDASAFIRANLRLADAPSVPEIRLYAAHPASGLRRLVGVQVEAAPPYWAYHWAGGAALARYILERPRIVAGRRVLDLGAGSGVVAIAAAMAGALEVNAVDIDRNAVAAIGLNGAANGVTISATCGDPTDGAPPSVDLITVGDLFYDQELATRVGRFLDRCVAAGIPILVGDPGRPHLPRHRLRMLAEYPVRDFGSGGSTVAAGAVFSFEPSNSRAAGCAHLSDWCSTGRMLEEPRSETP